jgi:hypothetical protein
VALGRGVVLQVAGDATELARVALGPGAHVDGVERAPQAVVDHRVGDLAVPHAIALARLLQQVGRLGHRLHPAGDDHLGVTRLDHLVGEVDGVDPREADLVDGHRRDRHRDATVDGRLAGRHLTGPGLEHLAEQHVVDLLGVDPTPGEGGGDGVTAELRGGERRQRPGELADRCTGG